MNQPLGVALIVAGVAAAALATLLGRRALAPPPLRPPRLIALAIAGACVGAGALLVQDRTIGLANWIATLTLAGVFVPVHAWIALGPPRAGASG